MNIIDIIECACDDYGIKYRILPPISSSVGLIFLFNKSNELLYQYSIITFLTSNVLVINEWDGSKANSRKSMAIEDPKTFEYIEWIMKNELV